jgi:micrococcal nuclease|tara:strand:+ start:310 stop:654 length:345 start_codon:yes stop_codon:yes gene_type:complete
MYIYKAKCLRVVDGDTLDAQVDLGFDIHKVIRVRLVGINTPESRTRDLEEKERGLAAKAFVKDILKKHKNYFILQSQGVGKYGRCLGEIFLGDTKLNDLLINEGHAVKYHGGKR